MKYEVFTNSTKTKNLVSKKIKQKLIIAYLLSMPIIANAQFVFIPGGGTSTAPINNKVGIGSFPTTASISAKLHVNSFLLAPNAPTNGFLFRTDGDQSVVNQWQLFTGTNATTQTQRFRLFVPAKDSTVILQSTTSSLILADNKTQISVAELKAMQEQIALLQQQLATLQKQLEELKK